MAFEVRVAQTAKFEVEVELPYDVFIHLQKMAHNGDKLGAVRLLKAMLPHTPLKSIINIIKQL